MNLEDYVAGLLLSDGSLCINNSNRSDVKRHGVRYQQGCAHKSWLSKIQLDLESFGIESKVNDGRQNITSFGSGYIYSLWTKSYEIFNELKSKWYVNQYYIDHEGYESSKCIKIIPNDIKASPECFGNLYNGDGNITPDKRYYNLYTLKLSTYCFRKEDVLFLSELINNTLDINSYITKRNAIQIGKTKDIKLFLDYIKEYKIDCYAYKFPDKLMSN